MPDPLLEAPWRTHTRTVAGLHVIEQVGRGATVQPLVVLIHGAMDRSTSFARTARLLIERSVVRYDRRGYGKSLHLPTGDVAQQVVDLMAIIGERPAVLVGHSMGGVIALAAADRAGGQIQAVCAYEAPSPWAPWWSGSLGDVALPKGSRHAAEESADWAGDAAERFMKAMLGKERWGRLPVRTRGQRREEGPALVADLQALREGAAPFDLARIRVPIVAAYGSEGAERHQRAARELAADARYGELRVVPGAGHGVHLSHPRAFAELVRHTLGKVHP